MAKSEAMMKLKIFFGYAITGGLFTGVALALVLFIGNMIGFEDPTDLEEIGMQINQLNFIAIGFAVLMLIILGGLVWLFAIIGVKIRRWLGSKEKETIKFNKRPAILALVGVGFIFLILWAGVNAFFMGVGGDAELLQSETLLQGLMNLEPLIIVATIIGLFVIGFLVSISAKVIPKATDSLPDSLSKV